MPRDSRLYMTFPNDFWMHPKVAPLPVEAKWAFVEMNGYSRMQDLDGRIPEVMALRMWSKQILDELTGSDPDRPLVVHEGADYVIRDYAEHQQTKDQREELSRKRAEAGRKGGLSKSQASATANGEANPKPALAESESRSEDFYSPSKSQSRSNRARVSTDAIEVSDWTRKLAAQKGITSLRVVVDAIHSHTSCTVTADQAWQLCVLLLDKAKTFPTAPQRYVLKCVRDTPAEVEKTLYEQIGVAS